MQWRESLSRVEARVGTCAAGCGKEKRPRPRGNCAMNARSLEDLAEIPGQLGRCLSDINSRLLDGQGELESFVSWEPGEDAGGDGEDGLGALDVFDDDDEDQYDAITHALSWEEFGEREIEVELVLAEDGASILVNGVEVRPERDALEMALLEAVRDELEL